MLKKLTVISSLLLNSMYALDIEPSDELGNLSIRLAYVTNFQRIAREAMTDSHVSVRKNNELTTSFNTMMEELGSHRLINLHDVSTQGAAKTAFTRYSSERDQILKLMSALVN